MKCERIHELLPLGVGKDLDASAQIEFDEHVAGCLTCFREVAAFRRSRAALKAARPIHDRDELDALTTSIMARVHAGEPGPMAAVDRSWLERARFALPLAAVFVGCAWAGLLLFGGGDGGAISPRSRNALDAVAQRAPDVLAVTPVSDQLGSARMIVIPPASVDRAAAGARAGDPRVVKVAPLDPWKIVRRADDF